MAYLTDHEKLLWKQAGVDLPASPVDVAKGPGGEIFAFSAQHDNALAALLMPLYPQPTPPTMDTIEFKSAEVEEITPEQARRIVLAVVKNIVSEATARIVEDTSNQQQGEKGMNEDRRWEKINRLRELGEYHPTLTLVPGDSLGKWRVYNQSRGRSRANIVDRELSPDSLRALKDFGWQLFELNADTMQAEAWRGDAPAAVHFQAAAAAAEDTDRLARLMAELGIKPEKAVRVLDGMRETGQLGNAAIIVQKQDDGNYGVIRVWPKTHGLNERQAVSAEAVTTLQGMGYRVSLYADGETREWSGGETDGGDTDG